MHKVRTGQPRSRRAVHARRIGATVQKKLVLSAFGMVLLGSTATLGSWAAWTVSDSNSGNSFSTNTVLLDDNQGGAAGSTTSSGTSIFNVTNLEPGSSTTTQCIGVDFSGTAPVSSLTLSAALGGAGQSALQGQLTMNTATLNTSGTVAVTPGSNTNSGSCSSYPSGGTNTTVGTQGATLQSWSGASPFTVASPVTNTWYKFTVSGLPSGDTSCATYCSQTITISLTWTLTTT
jgi:hypothetical protein